MKSTIVVDGTSYPCVMSMGALLRYSQCTGRDASTMDGSNLTDMATLLWCCVVSGCNHDHQDFPYDLMSFADALEASELVEWAASQRVASVNGCDSSVDDMSEERKKKGRRK